MVSLALVAFTLSALAVYGKKLDTDVPVNPPGCEGKTFCDIKPDDYPQEEIDNFFVENPEYLKRLKKEEWDPYKLNEELEEASDDGNGNCKAEYNVMRPFKFTEENKLPLLVVQSQYFNQEIPEVKCLELPNSNNTIHQCFRDLVKHIHKGSQCIQVTRNYDLVVYDPINKQMVTKPGVINVDCVCGVM